MSSVKYLFDQDFNGRIVRGVRRRMPSLDTKTVQEAGLSEAPDPQVLEWAAGEFRLVVSHDHRTMRTYAEERLNSQLPMRGLILIHQRVPLREAIESLVLVAETSTAEEWDGKIIFLPLR